MNLSLSVVSVLALRTNRVLLSNLLLFKFLLRTLIVHFVCTHLNYRYTRRMVVMNMVRVKERGRYPRKKERKKESVQT